MDKYYCNRKPRKCPKCGSSTIANILYGMPIWDERLQEKLDTNKTVLGGCVICDDDPEWHCTNCNSDIIKVLKST